MNKINSLSDLLMEELSDLLNAEDQLIDSLPRMAQASQSSGLKAVLEAHSIVSQEQAGRLRDIFVNSGQNPKGMVCKVMKELIAECEGVINQTEAGQARDIIIISIAQRMEHYEITGYAIAHEHADDLGHSKIVDVVDKILNEERTMHLRLSELAQGLINVQAIEPKGGGFYVPEGKFSRKSFKKKDKNPRGGI